MVVIESEGNRPAAGPVHAGTGSDPVYGVTHREIYLERLALFLHPEKLTEVFFLIKNC